MRKISVSLLLVCFLSISTAVNVLAANTSDTPINFVVNALNFDVKTSAREKQNKSALYCKITDLEDNSRVRVRAIGCNADGEKNKTCNDIYGNRVDYVTLKMGEEYSIHSNIYEDGYRSAKLAFKSVNLIYPERVVGLWSPDSTRPYTDATQ